MLSWCVVLVAFTGNILFSFITQTEAIGIDSVWLAKETIREPY